MSPRLRLPPAVRVSRGARTGGSRAGRSGARGGHDLVTARLSDVAVNVPSHQPAWPGRPVTAGHAHLFVRSTPGSSDAAEPALYVHGLAGSSTNWTDLAAALAPWLAGEAVDLPGFGRAGPAPSGRYTLGTQARVVIDHLERSGRGPVHLIGNSMGGAISVRVAAWRPDLVRTLTLISPAVPDLRLRWDGVDRTQFVALMPGTDRAAARVIARATPEQRVRSTIKVCFADPSRVTPERLAESEAEIRERLLLPWASAALTRSLRAIAASYVARGPNSTWRLLERITAPTLVIWGQHDKLVDVSRAPLVARRVADSRLLVLPDVGHVAQLEDPVVTARAIVALLEDAGGVA